MRRVANRTAALVVALAMSFGKSHMATVRRDTTEVWRNLQKSAPNTARKGCEWLHQSQNMRLACVRPVAHKIASRTTRLLDLFAGMAALHCGSVHFLLSQLRQILVGLFFLGEGRLQQLDSIFHAEVIGP